MEIELQTAVKTAAIPHGDTTSTLIALAGFASGTFTPLAAFTGASVTFAVSADGQNFEPFDSPAIAITPGRAEPLPAELFGSPFFQIVSAAAEGADRWITVTLSA